MNYKNQYQRKAHQEIDFIFLTLLPQAGLSVREEQVKLSHQMLDMRGWGLGKRMLIW
jgi:ATP-dependent DNA helicase DinG